MIFNRISDACGGKGTVRNKLFDILPKTAVYKILVYVLVIVSLLLFGSNWITLTGLSTNDRRSFKSSAREALQEIDEYTDDSYSSYYFESVEDETGVDVIKMLEDSRVIIRALEDAGFSPNEFRQLLSFSRKYWNAMASDIGAYDFSSVFGISRSDVEKGSGAITAATLVVTVAYLAVILTGILTFVFSFLRKRRATLAYSIAYAAMFVIIAAALIWFRTRSVESYFSNDEFGTRITAAAVIGLIFAIGASAAQHMLEIECAQERGHIPNITDLFRRVVPAGAGMGGTSSSASWSGYEDRRRRREDSHSASGMGTVGANSAGAGFAGRNSGTVQVCLACNRIVADEDVYCGFCGTKTQRMPRLAPHSFAERAGGGMKGSPHSSEKYCPYCGAKLVPGARFCPGCGRPQP